VFAGAIMAAGGVALLRIPPVQAEDGIVVNGQDAPNLDDYGGGMPRSNPRVQQLLSAHPDQFVVLCVAGCNGPTSKIVQLLPRPVNARTAEFQPSAAGPEGKRNGSSAMSESEDVVCVAGCPGKRGQVLQRDLDLPPPAAPKPPQEASDEPPPAEPPPAPKAPEPLDIHP